MVYQFLHAWRKDIDDICHEYLWAKLSVCILSSQLVSAAIIHTMHTSISGAVAYYSSYFGTSSPIFITNLDCRGTPSRILNCTYSVRTLYCGRTSGAGVVCISKQMKSILKYNNFCIYLLFHTTTENYSFITVLLCYGYVEQYKVDGKVKVLNAIGV